MTAFNLDVLLLLFGAFVLGLALGLWLRRARPGAPPSAGGRGKLILPLAAEAGHRPEPLARAAMPERPAPAPPASAAPERGARERSPASSTVAELFGHLLKVPPGAFEEPEPPEPEEAPRRPVAAPVRETAHPGVRPPALSAPEGVADDLQQMKGIGRQNEQRLHALGIFHFRQIAAWTAEEAAWVGSYLAFPGRIEREDWIGQARTLEEARRQPPGNVAPGNPGQGGAGQGGPGQENVADRGASDSPMPGPEAPKPKDEA